MPTRPLSDFFHVAYGNKFDLNKMTLKPVSEGGVHFVGRSSENHGVSAAVAPTATPPYPAGLITVALGGTKLLSSFVQERPFYTAQNVAVLIPKVKLSLEQKIYICIAIRHNRFRYSAFGREANRTIKTLEIPDVAHLPNWLQQAAEDVQSPMVAQLDRMRIPAAKKNKAGVAIGTERVEIGKLFDVNYGHNLELNKLVKDDAGVNFLSRTARNNGVSAKVATVTDVPPAPGHALTVALGGSVLETFLQLDPFYSGHHIYILRPNRQMTIDELLFYCCCIKYNKFRYSYGRQANRTLRQLMVPATSAIPNWVYGGFNRMIDEVRPLVATTTGGRGALLPTL